jgi:predicted PurR-regulated permease PerM
LAAGTDTNLERQRRNIYFGIGLAFALLIAAYLVFQLRAVMLVILVTLLLSIVISAPVDYLSRRGMGRGLGTLLVLTIITLVFGLAGFLLGSTVVGQVQQFVNRVPTLFSSLQDRAGQLESALGLQTSLQPDPQQILESAQGFLSGGTFSAVLSVSSGLANVLSFLFVILIATIFVVAYPAPLVKGVVELFPAGRRERAREILDKMYKAVQWWFLGQVMDMVIVGILFTVALFIIGVPFALLFGILAGLLALIPFVGPVISVIPPILVSLIEDPVMALWVLLSYFVIQGVESYLIQPVVMSHAVALHPAAIVFTLLISGTLFGAVGLLIGIPLVAALYVLVRELWIRRMDEKGTDPNPPSEEEPSKVEKGIGRLRRAAEARVRRS